MASLTTGKRDLVLRSPLLNAAGFLGCDGAAREALDFTRPGAYITPLLSLHRRTAAQGVRLLTFSGGFFLHTGMPNPRLRVAVAQDRRRWAELPCLVIVHLLLSTVAEAVEMVQWIESVEKASALELGLGEVDAAQAFALVRACAGELPLIAHLPLGTATSVFAAAAEAGAHAVSIGAPHGALPAKDGTPVRGRLYGPAVFPTALQAVSALKGQLNVPILTSGGVYHRQKTAAPLGPPAYQQINRVGSCG